GDRVPGEEQAARRMAEDGNARVAHRADEPPRLLLGGETEAGVDRGDDDVENLQELVSEVDRAVRENVRFRAVVDDELREPAPHGRDRAALGENALGRQPSGVRRGLT